MKTQRKMSMSFDQVTPLLGTCPSEIKMGHKNLCGKMFKYNVMVKKMEPI